MFSLAVYCLADSSVQHQSVWQTNDHRDGHLRCSSVDGIDYCPFGGVMLPLARAAGQENERMATSRIAKDRRAQIVRYSVSLRYESISELWEMRGQVRFAAIGEQHIRRAAEVR